MACVLDSLYPGFFFIHVSVELLQLLRFVELALPLLCLALQTGRGGRGGREGRERREGGEGEDILNEHHKRNATDFVYLSFMLLCFSLMLSASKCCSETNLRAWAFRSLSRSYIYRKNTPLI